MYCSSCGSAVSQTLRYCNRCGVKVDSIDKPSESSLEFLVGAIAAVFLIGLGIIIGLMAVMKKVVDFNIGVILFITMISFALMLGIECVLIWMLLRGRRSTKETGGDVQMKELATSELVEAQARALPEHMPSVTEQTTRAFEPVYSERKSK
jgi:heme/copper-type cytochrome/quinol oxidase subunit 2